MTPIIGLFCAVDNDATTTVLYHYAAAIEKAGGLPVVLPYTENEATIAAFLAKCDGVFFTGGADISPARYHHATHSACGRIELLRDAMEMIALPLALAAKLPIIAICRGAQLVNVALGGTLYQDLPSECPSPVCHQQVEGKLEFSHEVNLLKDSPIHALLGKDRIRANSFHHQAVRTLGQGLCIMARADDGTIEAFCLDDYPYLRAYQWHPERLYDKDEYSRTLFFEFISHCKGEHTK